MEPGARVSERSSPGRPAKVELRCFTQSHLLRLHVPAHIFRRHQTRFVPLGSEHAPEMMRAAACFHRNDAAPKTFDEALRRIRRLKITRPDAIPNPPGCTSFSCPD